MIALVERLVRAGVAYETDDGIYFEISRWPAYGKLSGIHLAHQLAGARIDVNEQKRSPHDFALWIKAPREHIMQWPSPWGMGYPGWHIECSAMSMHYLGESFDIHTGGVDHIPVHHENEIAQSEAATHQPLASVWMHSEFLLVDGGKMSKSLGNTYTLDTLEQRGYSSLAYRYFCLTGHYRSKLNFTWDALAGAETGLQRLRGLRATLRAMGGAATGELPAELRDLQATFWTALRDDLNAPKALAIAWDVARGTSDPAYRVALLDEYDRVLGLDLHIGPPQPRQEELPADIAALIDERETARKQRDWARADELRALLLARGYKIDDTPQGPQWTKV
jgi:cysteinyl-tRNA synthetase